jgi:hypothetical protein
VDEDGALTVTTHLRMVAVCAGVLSLGSADVALTAVPRTLVCKPPQGEERLPASARHGLIDHLRQYPDVSLARPAERDRARRILGALVAAAERGNWRSLAAAKRAGYDVRARARRAGDRTVYFFHAERSQEPRRGSIFNAARPKALIYANAPGHRLLLVGAMWSTRDGELGPTPAGPILRWHSHVVCKSGKTRGLKPPPSGVCPRGSRLQQGASEMLHVWFTRGLRSAFAVRAPRPELCTAGLLPRDSCG